MCLFIPPLSLLKQVLPEEVLLFDHCQFNSLPSVNPYKLQRFSKALSLY